MVTKAEFNEAAKRLLGEERYANYEKAGFTAHDLCREVAMCDFVGDLVCPPAYKKDLELIRHVAGHLWLGDGVTGLDD
jgi:hypothetical protein